MADAQILFRVPKKTLDELDEAISSQGFRTRNEWLRTQIRGFLEEARRKRLRGLLEKTTIEGIKEQDIVDMVKDWRARKRRQGSR
jgi:metal-responsive CopG/Arc/MetJ family transcriptional regulator